MLNKALSASFISATDYLFYAIGTCQYLEKTSFCTKTVVPTYEINFEWGKNSVCPIYIVFDDVNKQNPGVRQIDKAIIVWMPKNGTQQKWRFLLDNANPWQKWKTGGLALLTISLPFPSRFTLSIRFWKVILSGFPHKFKWYAWMVFKHLKCWIRKLYIFFWDTLYIFFYRNMEFYLIIAIYTVF